MADAPGTRAGTRLPAPIAPAGPPGPRAGVPRPRTVLPRAARYGGLAGAVLLAVAGYLGGAPVAWRSGATPLALWRGPDGPVIMLAWLAGTAAMVTAWWAVRRSVPSVRWALVTAGLWLLPVLVTLPMGSRDAYAYACQGAVRAAGLNPYRQGVAALPCRWVDSVSPIWRDTPAPYGPLFVVLAGAVVAVAGTLPLAVAAFRILALLGMVLTAATVPVLARRCGVPPARAAWLALASPLVAVHLASGAHNDALMIGLMVAGLALVASRPDRAAALAGGGLLLGLAGAVKATALVLLPFAILAARSARPADAGSDRPGTPAGPGGGPSGAAPSTPPYPIRWRSLLRITAWTGGGAAVAMLGTTWLSGLGFGWVGGLSHSGDSVQWTSPPTAVGMTIEYTARLFGAHIHAVPATRATALVVLATTLLVLLWRALRHGDALHRGALAMVAVVALAPVFHPWYALAPLALLAATARRPWWFAGISAALCFLVLPDGANLAVFTKIPGAPLMTLAVLAIAARLTLRSSAGRWRWVGPVRP